MEMDSTDESYFLTVYEPKNYDLMETYVEFFTESPTHPQFSDQRFLEGVDYDDTALEEMFHNAHRVHVSHPLSEKACLLSSRCRPYPSERVRRRLRNTSSRLFMTEDVHENWVK